MIEFTPSRAVRQSVRRQPTTLGVELLEARTVMSGSPGAEETLGVSAFSTPSASSVSAAAVDLAGNTRTKAYKIGELSTETTLTDFVGAGDAADYYKFAVASTADVRVALTGLSADIDVKLLTSGGKSLAFPAKPGEASETITMQLKKGTYYVFVAPYRSASSDYTLTVSAVHDAVGDTRKLAVNLGALTETPITRGDSVGKLDAHDYYKFTLAATTGVQIDLTGLSQNADLRLYSSSGKLLASSVKTGIAGEQIFKSLAKGTYYIDVDPFGEEVTSYVVSMWSGATALTPLPPVDPPTPVTPFANVPNYGGSNDWALNSINAPEAWAAGYTGQGVIVAVLDSGADVNHSEFAASLWINEGEVAGNNFDDDRNRYADDTKGWNFVKFDKKPFDDDGHGTHVSGIIAGAFDGRGVTGVAYNAQVMQVKVLDEEGEGTYTNIAAGIRYAVDNGARIINMSLGSASASSTVQTAIQYAAQNSVLIVVAAGNEEAAVPDYPARYSATFTNVISVGAYDSSNTIADFSNRVGNSKAVQVDAPGVNIYSSVLNGQYDYYSGTSMAAPHVAGLAALMLSANPNLTAAQLRTLIVATANRVIAGSDSKGGINAAFAVAAALNPGSIVPGAIGVSSISSSGSGTGIASAASLHRGAGASSFEFITAHAASFVAAAATPLAGFAAAVETALTQALDDAGSRRLEFGESSSLFTSSLARRAEAFAADEADLFAAASDLALAFAT